MAGPMTHIAYVADFDGNTYRVRQAIADQVHVGNALDTGAGSPHPVLPKGVKPRRRFYLSPEGRERSVTIGSIAQTAWTELEGTNRAMVDYAGVGGAFPITIASTNFVAEGRVGEKKKAL